MAQDFARLPAHPLGEQPLIERDASLTPTLDSWAGPVRVEWDATAPLTAYGQLPFFIEYLKVAGLFDALVADCPLTYTSPNAPKKRDVLGTTMLAILAGHKRYAHIAATVVRAMGSRHGFNGQAALRPSGRSGCRL
jgi:hypothetical protein